MTQSQNGSVMSVCGPISASDLGITLVHEHLIVESRCYWSPSDDPDVAFVSLDLDQLGRVRSAPFACRDNLSIDDPHTSLEELERYVKVGGKTIVDVSPPGLGRDVRVLEWLSKSSGLNVIAGCGYYIKDTHPPGMRERSVDSIAEEMILELTVGINETGILAGVIGEIGMATSPMDSDEKKVLEAAAIAQQETDVAIVTHTAPGVESAFEVNRILADSGADMSRVVHSHVDERYRTDLGPYRELASTGAVLSMDTFGRDVYYASRGKQHPSDEVRVEAVCSLIEDGLIDHLLLAQDICMKHELRSYGGQGYDHVIRSIVPRLINRGISDEQIDQMLCVNPARVLTGVTL